MKAAKGLKVRTSQDNQTKLVTMEKGEPVDCPHCQKPIHEVEILRLADPNNPKARAVAKCEDGHTCFLAPAADLFEVL